MTRIRSDNERARRVTIDGPSKGAGVDETLLNDFKSFLAFVRPSKGDTFLLESSEGVTFSCEVLYKLSEVRTKA